MDFLPGWSAPSKISLGRDPLGLQATSVRIYRSLIPGLTNVTNRLRYYSFYCWVVRRFEIDEHADNDARWRVFIRRAEALYAFACHLVDTEGSDGLAGSIWARDQLKDASLRRLALSSFTDNPGEADQYLRATRGNFGQFYVRSMIEIGLLQESSGTPLVSEQRGVEMAEAFARAVGEDVENRIARVLKNGSVSKDDAEVIGRAIHPGAIDASSREMTLLRDFLLNRTPDELGDGSHRRQTAWLLLDLAQNGVDLGSDAQVRCALYHRLLPSGKAYKGAGKTIDRWRAYQANELCHIALELWLNAIARCVNDAEGRSSREIIDELIGKALSRSECETSWHSWAAAAGNLTVQRQDEIAASVRSSLESPATPEAASILREAALLLGAIWARWSSGADGVREEIRHFAGTHGRSLEDVVAMLDAAAAGKTRAALLEVFREQIIISHLRIAARKLGAGGKFTYRFSQFDGVLSDGVVTEYGYTNPRIGNLTRFLRDAKLLAGNSLTNAGRKFLDEAQAT